MIVATEYEDKIAICLERQDEMEPVIKIFDTSENVIETLISIKSLRVDFLDFTIDGKYMCYSDEQGNRFFFNVSQGDQIQQIQTMGLEDDIDFEWSGQGLKISGKLIVT